jgi:hypothetical protein
MRKPVQQKDIAEIHPGVSDLEKENHSSFPLSGIKLEMAGKSARWLRVLKNSEAKLSIVTARIASPDIGRVFTQMFDRSRPSGDLLLNNERLKKVSSQSIKRSSHRSRRKTKSKNSSPIESYFAQNLIVGIVEYRMTRATE